MEIGLPAAGGVVFVRQAVFDHLELQAPTVPMILRPLSDEVKSCATPSSMS